MADNSSQPPQPDEHEHDAMLDPSEAAEIVEDDGDAAMDSGDEDQMEQTIELVNNSSAHFDQHKDSIFCIAQHPLQPEVVVTGGGDDIAFVWDATPPEKPVLPGNWATQEPQERQGQEVVAKLEQQDESVNAACFTLPKGEFVVTATLAGKMNVYNAQSGYSLVGSIQEVEEINWLAPCTNAGNPNTVAFGASDGSVWVYSMEEDGTPIMRQTFTFHQGSCTAGAWTPDGKMLATVAEDSSLYVYDVFGEAAAAGITETQTVVGLTGEDERFKVDGGLYSVAISPGGGIVAVGGAEGHIRVVGLPRLSMPANSTVGAKGAGAKSKTGGAKQAGGPKPQTPGTPASAGQAGQILASLQAQSDGVETLDFSQPPLTLLAAGSVDGSIALFDAAHNFAVRRHIKEAHEEESVIKVEFVKTPLGTQNPSNHVLTTCGNDGVIRRWDVRGGTAAAANGALGEWRGHRGGGEGGGIFGFVQGGGGKRVITAGDDGISLVFDVEQ